MIIENLNGSWIISEIINGYLTTKKYLFYTRKEAVASFKKYVKTIENN